MLNPYHEEVEVGVSSSVADSEVGSLGRLSLGEERKRESGLNSACTEAESELLVQACCDKEFKLPGLDCIADTTGSE